MRLYRNYTTLPTEKGGIQVYNEIICDFGNIYKAYKLAHRGKSDDKEVIEFDKNKMYNLHNL